MNIRQYRHSRHIQSHSGNSRGVTAVVTFNASLITLMLFTSPHLMAADPDRPEFLQLTVTAPSTDSPLPNGGGNILVNGTTGFAAAININAVSNRSEYDDAGLPLPPNFNRPPATLRLSSDGVRRWGLRKNGKPENGGNTGSNFEIERFDDSGSHKWPSPLVITRADNTITISGALVSERPCAAGYKRVGPNYCLSESGGIEIFDSSTSCTQTAALPGVTSAKAVLAEVILEATAGDAVGLRQVTMQSFGANDESCALVINSSTTAAFEFYPIPSGTAISKSSESRVIQSDGSGRFYANTINDSSGMGFVARYKVVGYYD